MKDPIWADYFNSDLRALLVLGDYYLMKHLSIPGRSRYIRDSQINSNKNFNIFFTTNL